MRVLLDNCYVLPMAPEGAEYPRGYVLVEDERILCAGEGACPLPWDIRMDGRGGLLLPGMVNLHCHASMVPFRTMGDDCPDRLTRFLFPMENDAMTEELVYRAARVGIAEMLLSGITTFVDMYYFEDAVARACAEMGMRGYLGQTVISQPSPDSPCAQEGLARLKAFTAAWKGHPLITPVAAPHGSTTVEADILRQCHALAAENDLPFTLHIGETEGEMQHFARQGTTPFAWLDAQGCMDERLLAVHCIHASPADVALLGQRGAAVAYCPVSNMKAGKGIAPLQAMAQAGVRWGLGTDGPSSGNRLSLLDAMHLTPLAQKTACRNRAVMPARQVVWAATAGGAACLRAKGLGTLQPGSPADLVLIRTDRPSLFPVYNPWSALVYGAQSADVDTVMVRGKLLVRSGCLTDVDLQADIAHLAEAMKPFRRQAEKYREWI